MPQPTDDIFERIQAAKKRISAQARVTPVMTSRTLDRRVGAAVFLKCENFQRAGAFKFRGAYNAMSLLSEQDRRRGVVTHSSGNHAQAIALAGQLLGVQTTVVMPQGRVGVILSGGNIDGPTTKIILDT